MVGSSYEATSPHRLAAALRQENGAPVQSERLTQLAGDGLEDVGKVEGSGDFFENLDHGQEVLPLVFELGDARKPGARPPRE